MSQISPNNVDPEQLTDEIKLFLFNKGASLVGIGDIRMIDLSFTHNYPICISMAIALNPEIIRKIPDGFINEYIEEYTLVNERLSILANFAVRYLKDLGYDAREIAPTLKVVEKERMYAEFPHKTAATRSGLGWVGRSALLVTKEFGSALRIVTVLTNAPLIPGKPVTSSKCGECMRCVTLCPVSAPTGIEWKPGLDRDAFWNSDRCFDYCTDKKRENPDSPQVCGMCIAKCIWTEKYIQKSLKREQIN